MSWHEWRNAPRGDYAVIGDPIGHSKSPQIHTAAYRELGLDLSYEAIRVPEGEFSEAVNHLAQFGYRGLNVTVPLKEHAFAWCRTVAPEAAPLRALNTIDLQTGTGTSTDGEGFFAALAATLTRCPFQRILLIGAGGSARAVAFAAETRGFSGSVWNRTPSRAEALVADLDRFEITTTLDPTGFNLIINCTSLGLMGEAVPLPFELADPDALVSDLAYGPASLPFLEPAREHGLTTVDGLGMLVHQAALAFSWWTGLEAPIAVMHKAAQ